MDELSETKTSRGCISLHTVLRLVLGFYWPVNQRTVLRILAWLYCLCFAFLISTCIIKMMTNRGAPILFVMPMVLEYNANVLISLLTGEEHIFKFLKRVQLMDSEMGCDYLPLMPQATRYIYLIIVIEKIMLWIDEAYDPYNTIYFSTISITISLAVNLNCLPSVLPLDLLRVRLSLLRQGLENNLSLSSINNTDDQIKILWETLTLYKNMIDNLSYSFTWQKIRICIAILCSLFAFLVNGSNIIYYIKNFPADLTTALFKFATAAGSIVLMWIPTHLPAVFSELVSREVDQLKTSIGNQLLSCEDMRLLSELEHALKYLELRPFSLRLYRDCALDGSFVLAFASLGITYLIVIIQIFDIV